MERGGERRAGSLPRSSIKYRQKPWVTHLLCLCQPASLSVCFCSPSVCCCRHLSWPHSCLFVGLHFPLAPHTHPILITNPPIQDYFHWHTMKWPSDRTHWAHLNLASLSSRPLRGRCSLYVLGWNTGRDRERQMIALKGKTTQFHNPPSALSSRPGQFNQHVWRVPTREIQRLWCVMSGWLTGWLTECPADWLIGWLGNWVID